jgi:hypothetical protein
MASAEPSRLYRDREVALLGDRLRELSDWLTEDQILTLSETLHEALRRRRGERSFHHVDIRL